MGYASYDTARGPAGYGHVDTCHADDCSAPIDRGLAYLCGTDPHSPDPGCGWWFCGEHLFSWGEDACAQLCTTCMDQAEVAP